MSFASLDSAALDIIFQRLSDGVALFAPASGDPRKLTYTIVDRDVQTVPTAFDTFNPGEKTTVVSFRACEIDPVEPVSGDQIKFEDETFRIREIIRFDGTEYVVSVITDDA